MLRNIGGRGKGYKPVLMVYNGLQLNGVGDLEHEIINLK
jgi:hypothetical protein